MLGIKINDINNEIYYPCNIIKKNEIDSVKFKKIYEKSLDWNKNLIFNSIHKNKFWIIDEFGYEKYVYANLIDQLFTSDKFDQQISKTIIEESDITKNRVAKVRSQGDRQMGRVAKGPDKMSGFLSRSNIRVPSELLETDTWKKGNITSKSDEKSKLKIGTIPLDKDHMWKKVPPTSRQTGGSYTTDIKNKLDEIFNITSDILFENNKDDIENILKYTGKMYINNTITK